ncbi:MAG: hypothetical protein ACFFAY_14140 [Promethearchaeota archaeon]
MSESIGPQLRVAAIFVFIGFIMTLGMTAGILANPEGSQFHQVIDPADIITDLSTATSADIQMRLAGIVFDSFFIVGYIAIFYGLFMLVKEKDPFFPKLAFILGLTTGVCDLTENAMHVALYNGIPSGWIPEGSYFASLWSFTFTKDLTSYMAGMIFIVLLLLTLSEIPEIKVAKLILTILVVAYVGLGSIAVVIPSVLLLRNLSFMIDMLVGSILLYRISRQVES